MGVSEQPYEELRKTRRTRIWLAGAVLFTLANLVAGVVAAVQGEPLHAGAHAAVVFLGAYVARRLARRIGPQGYEVNPELSREITDHLTHLERSVDAVAIEVERIGEGQRFITRIFTQNRISGTSGGGTAEPVETKALEAPPPPRRY